MKPQDFTTEHTEKNFMFKNSVNSVVNSLTIRRLKRRDDT